MEITRPPKTVTTLWAKDCPITSDSKAQVSGSVKIELTVYADKCKVTVAGKMLGSPNQSRVIAYRISGYSQYPPAPDWLIDFIAANSPTAIRSSNAE